MTTGEKSGNKGNIVSGYYLRAYKGSYLQYAKSIVRFTLSRLYAIDIIRCRSYACAIKSTLSTLHAIFTANQLPIVSCFIASPQLPSSSILAALGCRSCSVALLPGASSKRRLGSSRMACLISSLSIGNSPPLFLAFKSAP